MYKDKEIYLDAYSSMLIMQLSQINKWYLN